MKKICKNCQYWREGNYLNSTKDFKWCVNLESNNGATVVSRDESCVEFVHGFDGKIADVRVYDRILTAAEAAQIHSEGIGGTGVTDGLIFQGLAVKTKSLGVDEYGMELDKETVKTFSDPADVSISDEDNWANVSISHKIPKKDS